MITGKLKDILGHFHLRKYVSGGVKRKEEELRARRNRLSFIYILLTGLTLCLKIIRTI
jgi:hypothetical protein